MDSSRKIKSLGSAKTTPNPQSGENTQGMATLFVMIAVLTIIILFCCFAAPGVRDLCRRYVFRGCTIDDPHRNNVWNRRYGAGDQFTVISEPKKAKDQISQPPSQQLPQ